MRQCYQGGGGEGGGRGGGGGDEGGRAIASAVGEYANYPPGVVGATNKPKNKTGADLKAGLKGGTVKALGSNNVHICGS